MGLITKINGLAYANTAKYSGVTKVNTKKVGGTGNFHNKNAVAKSVTEPGDMTHGILLADSNGDFRFTDDSAFTFSLWIKVGHDASDGSSVYLLDISDFDATGSYDDQFLLYFYEPHNRLYFFMGSGGTSSNRRENFWHFHEGGGIYDAAYTASGGPNPWNSAARGNVGNDDYTMITITKTTANSSDHPDLTLYWNATDCGEGFTRGGSGGGAGTANLGSSTDKKIGLGSSSINGNQSATAAEAKFMNLTIWDKELSSSEVTELYNSGAPLHVGTHSAYANCVGWWPFQDDGTGQIAGTEAFTISGDSNIEAK
tara:strand:- start:561 stop:1499 length:939 start_codon:yes stop_codon:yes gene_type:complete